MMIAILIATVIELSGVTGSELRARAFFNANNVKVGDPLELTIDFLGEAEFRDLHPPALSKVIAREDWKVDDSSARTTTFRDARRLVYRVRPMHQGLLYFPVLEFGYDGKVVKSNRIPVHARAGSQIVVAEMKDETEDGYPKPPELVPGDCQDFAWKKALAHPSVEAFAAFDSAEAKMNEATCALNDGNWSRALGIYRRLEWIVGQTPEIERGIVAALARKYENPAAELPMWRQVLRPVLKYAWLGRIGIVFGAFGLFALIFWLLGRGIKAVASVALPLALVLPGTAPAQDIFEEFEKMHERMNKMMQQGSAFNMSFGGMETERRVPEVKATFKMKPEVVQVGENFEFILELETPKTASIGQIRISPTENFGITFTGQAENLPDGKAVNASNVVKRLSLPARYDVPFKGKLGFAVEGMITGKQESNRRNNFFSFSFSNSFRALTPSKSIAVNPLPSAGQPADFAGIISEGLRLQETCDLKRVGTNDVVTITYALIPRGYVPKNYLLPGADFEWTRQEDSRSGRLERIEYRRFFVADGALTTPKVTISYYDPRKRAYASVSAGGTPLLYHSDEL